VEAEEGSFPWFLQESNAEKAMKKNRREVLMILPVERLFMKNFLLQGGLPNFYLAKLTTTCMGIHDICQK
jgi:hypothetical protein